MKFAGLVLILLIDGVSKWWASMGQWVPLGSLGGVSFALQTVLNTGAAWGLLAGHAGILFLLRLAIIGGFMVWGRPLKWPMWLVLTGALGNTLDYVLYGAVVDFLSVTFWGWSFPVFNVADAAITIGAACLIFQSRREHAAPLHS